MTYEALLAEHVAVGFEKQALLDDLIGERPWAADLEKGSIFFGDDIAADTEVLGSEDDRVGTWLWAWANEDWGLAPGLIEASLRAQELGEELDVPELAEESFPLDELRNGHGVAPVCLGPYYCQPAVSEGRSVMSEVEVAVGPATAFEVFTEEVDLWWVRGPINFSGHADRVLAMRIERGPGGGGSRGQPPGVRPGAPTQLAD